MSLNWHHKRFATNGENTVMIEPDPNEAGSLRVKPKSEALIFSFMFIWLTEITEKNVDEFWRRLNLWQTAFGSLFYGPGGTPGYFTREDIVEHIGLSTNVFPAWSAKKWDTEFKNRLFEEMSRKASRGPKVKRMPTEQEYTDAERQVEAVIGAQDMPMLVRNLLDPEQVIGLAQDWHQGRDDADYDDRKNDNNEGTYGHD